MTEQKNSYWAERAIRDKIKVINTSEQGIDNLKRLLKKNLDSVEKEIKNFYKKYGEEGKYAESLSHFEWQKYKAKLSRQAKLNPQDKTLQRLAKQNIPKYKIDRLKALEIDLQLQLTEATNGQQKGIYKTLNDVAKVSQATTAARFKATLDIAFNKISTRKMTQILSSDWSGKNWSDRLWIDRDAVGKKVQDILEIGIPQGKSMQSMTSQLRQATTQSFNNCFRLIRTESAHVDAVVLLDSFKQAKEELGYTKYIFDATIDSRTSEICEHENNKTYYIDDAEIGVNFPPLHPNCRSTAILDENSADENLSDENKEEKQEKSEILKALENTNIEKIQYTFYDKKPTTEQIIDNLGGGDLTKGSCSSLAFAYAGNRANMKILDFRGGQSRIFFGTNGNIENISKLKGVESYIEKGYNDFVTVNKLLYNVSKNKEYYLATGRHAAIIRKTDKGFEFLELQNATDNGFKKLTKEVLKKRFKCQKKYTVNGLKAQAKSVLIEINTLAKNKDFKAMLQYINTDKSKQQKGLKGFAK